MLLLSINYTGEEDIPSLNIKFYLTENEYEQLSDSEKKKVNPIIKKIGDKYVFLIYKINTTNEYIREVIADIINCLYDNKPVPTYKDYSFKIRFIETAIEYIYSYTVEDEKVINEELFYRYLAITKDDELEVNQDSIFESVTTESLNMNKAENIKRFALELKSNDELFGIEDRDFYSQIYGIENLSSLSKIVSSSLIIDFPILFSIDDYDIYSPDEFKVYYPNENTFTAKEQFRRNKIESVFIIHERNIEKFGKEEYIGILESILKSVSINVSLSFNKWAKPDLYILPLDGNLPQCSIYHTRNVELLNTITISALAIFHAMHDDLQPVPLFLDVNKMSNILILSLRVIFANSNELINNMQKGNNVINNQLILINENEEYTKDIDDSIFDRFESYIPQYTMNESFDKNALIPF